MFHVKQIGSFQLQKRLAGTMSFNVNSPQRGIYGEYRTSFTESSSGGGDRRERQSTANVVAGMAPSFFSSALCLRPGCLIEASSPKFDRRKRCFRSLASYLLHFLDSPVCPFAY